MSGIAQSSEVNHAKINERLLNHFQFSGLLNYTQALVNPTFWRALVNTFALALLTLPLTMVLGMFFDYLLPHRNSRMRC